MYSKLFMSFIYEMPMFNSKNDYVNQLESTLNNLNVDYLKDSLTLYLIANLIILILFFLHHLKVYFRFFFKRSFKKVRYFIKKIHFFIKRYLNRIRL